MKLLSHLFNGNKNSGPKKIRALIGSPYLDGKTISRLKKNQINKTKEILIRENSEWTKNIINPSSTIMENYTKGIYGSSFFFLNFPKDPCVITLNDEIIFRIYEKKSLIFINKVSISKFEQLDVFIWKSLSDAFDKCILPSHEKNHSIQITAQLISSDESQFIFNEYLNNEGMDVEFQKIWKSLNHIVMRKFGYPNDPLDNISEQDFVNCLLISSTPYKELILYNYLKFKKTSNLSYLLDIFKHVDFFQKVSFFKKIKFKLFLYLFKLRDKLLCLDN